MLRRIELILKTQNLTPTQLADTLGIQRSGLSHILAGRNNPSLDFILKVLKAFPEIQSDWLLFGRGPMYAVSSGQTSLPLAQEVLVKEEVIENNRDMLVFKEEAEYKSIPEPLPESVSVAEEEQEVEKIVIFYKNGSFKVYQSA